MFEKVNPSHPDKVADRIAGAIVDLAYKKTDNPKIAVEVLVGHGKGQIIIETDTDLSQVECVHNACRISGVENWNVLIVAQDRYLSENQDDKIRCGDNGIFRGMPPTSEKTILSHIASMLYEKFSSDGKYIIDRKNSKLVICQSQATINEIREVLSNYIDCENVLSNILINPLGQWTGGLDVDCGATNRKLGSDMGDAVTGGGLHGKDLSKADVSLNIFAHIMATMESRPIELSCAIGDDTVQGLPYEKIVEIARAYIKNIGGFEKFAEWGLISV